LKSVTPERSTLPTPGVPGVKVYEGVINFFINYPNIKELIIDCSLSILVSNCVCTELVASKYSNVVDVTEEAATCPDESEISALSAVTVGIKDGTVEGTQAEPSQEGTSPTEAPD
jgi:hypothetical protein